MNLVEDLLVLIGLAAVNVEFHHPNLLYDHMIKAESPDA
jgi:hypothetical protein